MPPSSSRSGLLPLALVLIAAVAAGLGLWASQHWRARNGLPPLQSALAYPEPRTIPPFALQQADGRALDNTALKGRWSLVFFGFTHCPDICPTTLMQLAQAEKQWSDLPSAQQPRIVFVSVDPERDTLQRAGEYAAFFSPRIIAATAGHDVLEPFARSLGMVYAKTALENDDYTVDHSASIAVLDPDVRLAGVIRPPLDPARIAADMKALAAYRP